jgi:hypothetical protein
MENFPTTTMQTLAARGLAPTCPSNSLYGTAGDAYAIAAAWPNPPPIFGPGASPGCAFLQNVPICEPAQMLGRTHINNTPRGWTCRTAWTAAA